MKINLNALSKVRESLNILHQNIEPHSEVEKYREYAIRCISDANSYNSRVWRRDFLNEFIAPLYLELGTIEE